MDANFKLSELEELKYNAFINAHMHDLEEPNCEIKTYQTSIGICVKVICNVCGEIEDITDYGCW